MGCVEGCVMGKTGRMTRARRILLIVGMTALCAGVAPASIFRRGGDKKPAPATPAVAPAALSLTSVEVEPSPSPRLVLRTSGSPVYSSYSPAPDQFVVEFTGTSKGSALAVPSPLPAAVQSVSVDETTDMGAMLTRVTVRMTQPLAPQISVVENAVVVTLPEVAMASAVESPKPVVTEEAPAVAPIVEAVAEPTVQSEPVAAETHAVALAPAPSNKAKTLKKVETSGSGNALEVQLAGDGDITYKSFRLVNPARVVIDLAGVRNAVTQKTLNVSDAAVHRVRVGQFKDAPDPITRVVLEIDEKATYRIDKDGSRLRVTFGGAAPAMAASNMTVTETKTTIVEQPPMTTAAVVAPVRNDPPKYDPPKAEPAKPADIPSQVPVVAENATWKMPPAASKGATQVINAPAPQTPPKASPQPRTTRTTPVDATPAPAEDVFNDAAQSPAVQPSQSGAVLGGTLGGSRQLSAGEHVYTGEPISLNLKDADIKDVLRTFAQLTGLNMAIDPGVSGSVTVDFVEVPWDQALDIILRQNGLRFVLDGNVMRIGTIERITREEEAVQALAKQQSENVPLQTVSFKLSYARAVDVQSLLKDMASSRARIIVDGRTNQLIISEIPQYLQTMRNLIDAVDVPTRQVVIEARIVETSKLFTQQYGFITGFHGTLDPSLGTGTGLVFPNKVDVIGGPFDFGGGGNPLVQLSLGNVLGTFTLDLALTASEFEGLTRIISAPRVTTQDNVPAEIQSGFQIPYQTRVNFTTTVTYVDATLRLSVTPQITEAGTIIMDIQVQKNEPNTTLAIAVRQRRASWCVTAERRSSPASIRRKTARDRLASRSCIRFRFLATCSRRMRSTRPTTSC
jgi:type IV pilus secretin PilQ/predicted competence protein